MTDEPVNLREVLAANVRHYRIASGRSQTAIAEAAGMSRTNLVNIESKRTATSIEMLAALARALGVTASALITEPDRCPTCGQYVVGGT